MISVSIRLTSPAFIFSTVISLLTLVSIAAGAPSQDGSHRRQKRHILQMCELISTHTNRGCLDYNNYGCFCGLGNMGSRPVDGVDRCCRIHDQCYGNVACFWIYPQFVGYSVNCSSNAECTCTDSRIFSPCAYTTCQCDLEFAQCLGRHKYNHTFSDFNRSECNRPGRRLRRAGRRRRRRMAKKERRELRELTKRQQKKVRSRKE